ncbi:hypothetical protein ACFLX0_02465, partial [Chloroflexota bacterium]
MVTRAQNKKLLPLVKGEREGFLKRDLSGGEVDMANQNLTDDERQKIIEELKDFHKELKSYGRLLDPDRLLTEAQKRYRDSLREKLQRKIGKLKDIITQLTGKQYYTQFGTTSEVWADGLRTSGYLSSIRFALSICIDVANEAIGKLESDIELGVRDEQGNIVKTEQVILSSVEPPKAFIAHEGETRSLTMIKEFLEALGIQYFIAESKASNGRSIEKQVNWTQTEADFAICLATKGKAINKKTGKHYMGLNVADELGRARLVYGNHIILL